MNYPCEDDEIWLAGHNTLQLITIILFNSQSAPDVTTRYYWSDRAGGSSGRVFLPASESELRQVSAGRQAADGTVTLAAATTTRVSHHRHHQNIDNCSSSPHWWLSHWCHQAHSPLHRHRPCGHWVEACQWRPSRTSGHLQETVLTVQHRKHRKQKLQTWTGKLGRKTIIWKVSAGKAQ